MDKVKLRPSLLAATICLLVLGLWVPSLTAHALDSLEPTQMLIGSPPTVTLGQHVMVQAVLGDSQGRPISKAHIYFTTEAQFLGDQNEVVLAEAVTNSNGQAVAEIVDDFSYSINLRAEFKGDSQYAPSEATMQINAASERQVYSEHVGVAIPGYNVPPASVPMASVQAPHPGLAQFVQSLWPAMTGWPVAAVLILVWSMYLLAVMVLLRVPKSAGDSTDRSSGRPD